MGVIYKVKPEIKEFLLEEKKANPNLSCRILAQRIQEKFQFNLSKSSINAIIKDAGLSMPVGRHSRKKRRAAKEQPQTPPPVEKTPTPTAEPTQNPPEEIKEPAQPISVEKTPMVPPPAPAPIIEEPLKPAAEEVIETECTGAILLKAMDALIRGAHFIVGEISRQLASAPADLSAKTEALIYMPLFNLSGMAKGKLFDPLCALVEKEIFLEDIFTYVNSLQSVSITGSGLLSGVLHLLRQVRGFKVILSTGKELYLDAQLNTVWPTQQTPYSFSTTIYDAKSYINKYFFRDEPLVIFTAPAQDAPSEEFFTLLLSTNVQSGYISRLDIYGDKFEQLQSVQVEQEKRRVLVFGLWPNQFVEYRTIKKIGEYRPYNFAPLKSAFLIADVEIELLQPTTNQQVTLKGCVLKRSPAEKPCLIILSNKEQGWESIEKLADTYLSRWPNLEEGLLDFSRKVEQFSYFGAERDIFSTRSLAFEESTAPIKVFFENYLKILGLYFRWYFLGEELKNKDFPTIKKVFYDLKATIKRQKRQIFITFHPPAGFLRQKELEYACRRLNQRQIEFSDGCRLWFAP